MPKENDILETTLSLAESSYPEAYRYLLDAYQANSKAFGPQTFYFLACLAGGAGMPEQALAWLRSAIADHAWWYRPEVLTDDDLAPLNARPEFLALKSLSDQRYADAVSRSQALFSWKGKHADSLFLAVHGNTQNGQTARADWEPILGKSNSWQLEAIQSAEPDGYGTYRWRYDGASYAAVAQAMEAMQSQGYQRIVCGGFSAGCDMLLRSVLFTDARCDMLILQSPWIPLLHDHAAEVVQAIRQKQIRLAILCGSEDEDCLPLARHLHAAAAQAGLDETLHIQKGTRHQFPAKPYALADLL